jgi:hypothetical protein
MEQKDEPDDAKLQIESMLATAYTALQRREFDTVDRTLAAAEKLASDRSSADRIARWRGFAHYAKEFFNYRDQALNSVEAGHEYDIDGKKIGVVEIDADKFIYRFKGRNKTASRDNIPSGIVLAIVSEWFDARRTSSSSAPTTSRSPNATWRRRGALGRWGRPPARTHPSCCRCSMTR